MNTEPLLLGGKYRVRLLGASGHNIFINQSTHNLILCVFLLGIFLNTYCWFINIELMVNSAITHL